MAESSIDVITPVIANKVTKVSPTNAQSITDRNLPDTDYAKFSLSEVQSATSSVEKIVNAVSDTSLSFSFEEVLQRMVVAVRAVGSDEIIRQFPPEEFISVAKFIQAQDVNSVSEDFLKGILFDDRI